MDNLKIRARIAAKTDTKNNMERLLENIENLNDEKKFSMDTYLEFKERIGSKISECQKSIQEAEKLLTA